jgi:hypothetical protein
MTHRKFLMQADTGVDCSDCGSPGAYILWIWDKTESDYVMDSVLCRSCGDHFSEAVQRGEC